MRTKIWLLPAPSTFRFSQTRLVLEQNPEQHSSRMVLHTWKWEVKVHLINITVVVEIEDVRRML
jgi:hypothetical protein